MKKIPCVLVPLTCAWFLAGCADGSVAKRDDSRYVTLPADRFVPGGTPDAHTGVLPGETGRELSAEHAYATAVVTGVTDKEQRQRDDQEKLADDLSKLGKQ